MTTLVALLLLAPSIVAAEPRIERDIPYVTPKNARQALDIYSPPDAKDRPIFFWIHGGGWQAGDKADVKHKPQAFVDKGYVFVSVNYRLLPDATIKEMAQDVAKGLRWVHDHAEDYGGNADSIVISGHSAGAQLAALLCTDESYLKAEGLSLAIVKGCIPSDGDTYDVPLQIKSVEERIGAIYARKFGDEAQQRALSAVTHAVKGKKLPPFLILYVADHPHTKAQGELLANTLQAAGHDAKAYPAQGKTHETINADLGTPGDKVTEAVWEFLAATARK